MKNDQKKWMKSFNSVVRKSKTKCAYRDAVFKAWQELKDSEGCRYFAGFVSTEDLDKQNDVVESNMALDRIMKHINRGGTMIDTHSNRTVGSFFHAEKKIAKSGKPGVYAYGVIYRGEPYFDGAWENIKKSVTCPDCNGVRAGFSIGGFAIDAPTICDANGCHRVIKDMSIHEISICQTPANNASVYYEVNVLAKSDKEMDDMNREINKELREDSPSEDVVETPSPEGSMDEQMIDGDESDVKALIDKVKNTAKNYKDFVKLREALNAALAEMGSNMSNDMVAKAECGCMNLNTELHTPIGAKECPMPKELYGDEVDPAKRKFLDNKYVEADDSVAKPKSKDELMPGKPAMEFEKGPEGPAFETSTTKIKGFTNLQPKNASLESVIESINSLSSEDKEKLSSGDWMIVPKEHLEEDMGDADKIQDLSNAIEEEAVDIREDDEEELEDVNKASKNGSMTKEQFKSKYAPKGQKKNMNDKGNKPDSYGKEKGDAMQKMGEEVEEKVTIPKELLGAFQDFLKEKGIKMEPEADEPGIEEVIEKTIYIDENVTSKDLEMMKDMEIFKASDLLGKMEMLKMQAKNIDMSINLLKKAEPFYIEYYLL
ncbi:MAG: hypothetical protein WC175_03690 [Candidatus Dojkabacteria bacterium]